MGIYTIVRGTSCVCVCGLRVSHLEILEHATPSATLPPIVWIKFLSKKRDSMSFSAFATGFVVATLSHCSSISLPPPASISVSHTHTLALSFSPLDIFFYFSYSCFAALILTAVDMHIMGIERERERDFSSVSVFCSTPPLCFLSLSRDWFSLSVSLCLAGYFIAFEIASIFFHLLHLSLV